MILRRLRYLFDICRVERTSAEGGFSFPLYSLKGEAMFSVGIKHHPLYFTKIVAYE